MTTLKAEWEKYLNRCVPDEMRNPNSKEYKELRRVFYGAFGVLMKISFSPVTPELAKTQFTALTEELNAFAAEVIASEEQKLREELRDLGIVHE